MTLPVRVTLKADGDRRATAEAAILLGIELHRAGVTVQPATTGPPPNSKPGAAVTFETLVVYALLSPTAAAAFTKVVVAFLHRQSTRKIIIEHGGDRIEMDGASAANQRAVLEAWCAARLTGTEQPSIDVD
ncbi:MAG: effector-associated constant component EACC1 [Pseudonocardiaceae bacterium]